MNTHFTTSLVGASALLLAACGSSDTHGGTPASGAGSAQVLPAGNGGGTATPGAGGSTTTMMPGPTGTGGASTPLPGAGGAMITGTGTGGTTMPPPGGGGMTTSMGGSGTAGASTTCDDNAMASAKDPCNPGADPCNLHSGYPGDDYCILPPPADKGIQIHLGPKNYTDMAEVKKYLMNPGDEFNAYALATVPGASTVRWYNYIQIRMRPGSHHLINSLVSGADSTPDGFVTGSFGCGGTQVASFPGTQNLIRNMPPNGIQAPENKGLGNQFPANVKMCLNYHSYNFNSDKPILREIWINVWFVPESEVTQKSQTITVTAGPYQGIPPHSMKVLKATGTASADGRIIDMFGHRHAATDRFAVWKNDELVYDSWHWDESVAFDYNSITTNPAPNPMAKTDGATSGILSVKAGDKINIECDVNNTTDNTLTFSNELYKGEMCILFGGSVNTSIH